MVAVQRVIPARPQAVFDLLADPAQHPVLDGSGWVRGGRGEMPPRLHLGARFGMDMRLVVPYRVSNVVVEFEESKLIAWRHFVDHRWRYTLAPLGDGTLVRAEWDPTAVPRLWPWLRLLGFPERNRRGMEATLLRLADLVAPAPG